MNSVSMFKAMHVRSVLSSEVLSVGSRRHQYSCYCTASSRYYSTLDRMGVGLNVIRQMVHINHIGSTSGSALMRISWSRSVAQFSSLKSSKLGQMKKNGDIKFPTLRVVFKNEETGASEWKIMSRKDAMALAKSKSLDLLLGACYVKSHHVMICNVMVDLLTTVSFIAIGAEMMNGFCLIYLLFIATLSCHNSK